MNKTGLMAVAAATMAALASTAADYYVDNVNGDDAGAGTTRQTALKSLKAATARLKPGDTLHLLPQGVFSEMLAFNGPASGGTPDKPIVVKGHGATLTGLKPVADDGWADKGDGLWLSPNKCRWGACVPHAYLPDMKRVTVATSDAAYRNPAKLQPGEGAWNGDGLYFRVEAGKRPQDYRLSGAYQINGVEIDGGASYIVVEDLIAEYVANDGVNVHGPCRGLVFRNIEGRWCGDEGFSVHEDVQANVYNGYFHHNDDGICDICASQTLFFGCRVEKNVRWGVGFHGGMRVLCDSVVRDNGGVQIYAQPGRIGKSYGFDQSNPMLACRMYMKNVRVEGGEGPALRVNKGAEVVADQCTFSGTDVGVDVRGGVLHLNRSEVRDVRGERVVKTADGVVVEK